MKLVYTIKRTDVGNALVIPGYGYVDVLGIVLSVDVGKRLHWEDGIFQVENQEQFKARTTEESTETKCELLICEDCGRRGKYLTIRR